MCPLKVVEFTLGHQYRRIRLSLTEPIIDIVAKLALVQMLGQVDADPLALQYLKVQMG